ncbi:ABC transporter substrate-binding protein [Allomeiothermus silvanus]|uniref:ABC transporter substrate-binding protein n=1 Tax=Allomeiothermus silvanus TaxID=52022 RepID=UPI0023F39731|nr:ABC transporter substrate-binding protein [Allomeiothermus silvanus]
MRRMGWLFLAILIGSLAGAQNPIRGGTLQIAVDSSPAGLDPHVATAFATFVVIGNIYEGLTEIDEGLRVRPALAESWKVSPDGLTYTFKLRSGVTFHNGQAFDAKDVLATFNRVRDPKTGSPIASRFNLVKEVRANGPLEVVFELSQPFSPFLSELAGLSIVPAEYIASGGDLQRRAVGTGPFQLKEWVPDTYILLERNPKYYRQGRPYLDALKFNIVPDAATRQIGISSGTYHFLPNIDPSLAVTLKNAPGVKLYESQDLSYSLLGMNVTRKPFDNPKVREALNYAVDRKALVQAVYFGNGVPGGPLSPALKGWASPVSAFPCYSTNPQKARELLRQAGYPNGVDFTILTLGSVKTVVDAAQVLQAQLAPAGFRAKIEILELGKFVQEWRNSNFDAFASLNGGSADPDGYLFRTFSTGGSTNVFKYSDPGVDQLLNQGRTATSADTRRKIYAELQVKLACQGPIAHLVYGTLFSAARENVQGFKPIPTRSLLYLRETWLAR